MTIEEQLLYHQLHPAKLAADIAGSIVSTYLVWEHHFWWAMLGAFVPALLGSALVLRFANLGPLKQSRMGRYIVRFMNRWIEAWRFAGQVIMWVGDLVSPMVGDPRRCVGGHRSLVLRTLPARARTKRRRLIACK